VSDRYRMAETRPSLGARLGKAAAQAGASHAIPPAGRDGPDRFSLPSGIESKPENLTSIFARAAYESKKVL
jgi:hypothetical protein